MISSGHYASTHDGLVIYLHEKWSYRIKNYQTESQIWENQIIEICDLTYSNSQGIIIENIYRPPYNSRNNYATFTGEFNDLLLEYYSKIYNTNMCGDYNINLLKVNKIYSYNMYFNYILLTGCIPTITIPTRLSTSSTLIDNIFTTNISKEVKACILNVLLSDHQPTVLFIDDKAPVSKSKYITIKTNSEQTKAAFSLSFRNQQVQQKIDAIDPNSSYAILEKSLKNSPGECFLMRVVNFNPKRHKKTPFITDDFIKSINVRNKFYKKLKQCRSNAC